MASQNKMPWLMVLPFSTERVLVGSSMAASLVYWSSQLSFVELFGVWNWNGAVHGQALLKGTAIFLLATVVLFRILERGRWGRGRQRWKHQRAAGLELVCAFGAHMVGDLVLAYGHLLASLPFFLLGHVLYALAFAAPVRLSFESLCEGARWVAKQRGLPGAVVLGTLLLFAACSALLLPAVARKLGPLAVPPVLLYMCSVLVMMWSALLARRANAARGWGVVLYAASDSVLALHEFCVLALPAGHCLSWPLYYAAQLLICLSAT